MDSCLALQILSKHLTLEVDFLQAVLKVHYTLRVREIETWLVKHLDYKKLSNLFHLNIIVERLRGETYKVRRHVEFVELVSGLQYAGNQAGHQDFLPQLVGVCGSSLTAGHLHCPLVCVCYNADSLCYGLIQNWMLQRTEMVI